MYTEENNLISIITPVYNAERFIEDTIKSVQQQTYQNWELILVDDCSQDNSRIMIEKYVAIDSRFKLISLKENLGAAEARNKGLDIAKGRFIAFIDSDDCWHREKLSRQLAFMIKQNYLFTYTNFALVNESGEILKESVVLPERLDYYGLLKNTAIACSTVMIDRDALGDFRMPLVRKGQDTATWLMLMRERAVIAYGLDQVLNYYRQVEGSISSNKWGAIKRTWNTYRNIEKLPLIECLYYFSHYIFQAIKRRI
ncbi:glycosyltransferase family 2 protein [Facklamia sp. DSM 111018]|uniref:Glycosyltransferase family 2 protein n=1 Tax=Facklamia lactis TaxID=2749967 RepID=A0ABS0LRJ7_9LACT|nr:glycosyltransferase family 2 protein [Facklamia lactis]MBG9980852.1 glycosyltransferase family 2 protein [Facklamia lactis]MBG9986785.1 glycosyltransferase family 2 protein [Facklamia lactis]